MSKTLRPLTARHEREAWKHLTHEAWYPKKGELCRCTDCGLLFEPTDYTQPTVVCPHCGSTLTMRRSRRKKFQEDKVVAVLQTVNGIQLVRYLEAHRVITHERKDDFYTELMRVWVRPDGEHAIEARSIGGFFYAKYWRRDTEITLKDHTRNWSYWVDGTCGHHRTIAALKRNGFDGDFHGEAPLDCLVLLLTNSRYETLWKAGYWDFLRQQYSMRDIDGWWDTVKIAVRHGYHPLDSRMWFDMLKMERDLGYDTRNPFYVCPADLKAMHDLMDDRRRKEWERQAEEERRKRLRKNTAVFMKKKPYFGICFGTKDIMVTVLSSIEEYEKEGEAMHHCVFSNEYFAKPGSLILSAKDKSGARLATVELSLKTFKVMQCRAAFNAVPERHDEIVRLVQRHAKDFRKAKELCV